MIIDQDLSDICLKSCRPTRSSCLDSHDHIPLCQNSFRRHQFSHGVMELMNHFSNKATGVSGNWTSGTNLAAVKKATLGGAVALEDAVSQTWTALLAARHGFTDSQGVNFVRTGNYTKIKVIFTVLK